MAWRRCGEPAPSPPDWQRLAARLAEALRKFDYNPDSEQRGYFCAGCDTDGEDRATSELHDDDCRAARGILADYAAATGRAPDGAE